MIKLRSLNYNHSKVQVIYLLKSEIGRMARNETENITYITMKNNDFVSYDVLETPEEILAMPDIETSEKVIDWEQRRYEIAKEIFGYIHEIAFEANGDIAPSELNAKDAVEYADALINELKKGQDND